jgi:septal ring factor EnvC (AmiA/AmiB activator)
MVTVVVEGNIVRGYGRRSVEGVTVDEPDIAIRTSDNASVKAVFEGQVVQALGGIVVIKHGEYFSFYCGSYFERLIL